MKRIEGQLIDRFGSNKDSTNWEAVESVLRTLPLERCSFERNPATGEVGWHAPGGYAFKIGGKFTVYSQQSGLEMMQMPQQSKSLFIEEHLDDYQYYLRETRGNRRTAFALLMEDVEDGYGTQYTVPRFFIGKWIVIAPNIDGSPSLLPDQEEFISAKLKVTDEVDAEINRSDYLETFDIKSAETDAITRVAFSSEGIIQWRQFFAEAVVGRCHITCIEQPEDELHLVIPEPDTTLFIKPLFSGIVDPPKPCNPGDIEF